jgi:hypothetical protein
VLLAELLVLRLSLGPTGLYRQQVELHQEASLGLGIQAVLQHPLAPHQCRLLEGLLSMQQVLLALISPLQQALDLSQTAPMEILLHRR